jgi:hypothetical protein
MRFPLKSLLKMMIIMMTTYFVLKISSVEEEEEEEDDDDDDGDDVLCIISAVLCRCTSRYTLRISVGLSSIQPQIISSFVQYSHANTMATSFQTLH